GSGLSASLARLFSAENMSVVLAARDIQKLKGLREEINCDLVQCDVTNIDQVENLFAQTDQILGKPSVVVYNPSARIRGDITSLDPAKTKLALETTCYGAFLVAQQAAIRMTKAGRGSIFFTGASAGIKGFPNSSVFAMGKFGLRGLAQSLARELQPKNIHVAHFVIDGGISSELRPDTGEQTLLNPDEIAKTYLHFHRQDRSIWSWEIELRPWVEKF
ncbi:SDR family oxidoreductase, partial [Alphaproteobacteria bacterium]|nr:SDR family oxidoreductase [Alphaproteobacteria bacterium]